MQGNREIWKAIDGYDNYEVSSFGRVRNVTTARILKSGIDRGGYHYVSLYKDGKEKKHRVHRLVAEAFCKKKEGCDVVDHIDRCKTNNMFTNLRWTTVSGNGRNQKMYNTNTSGIKGVCFEKKKHRWQAQVYDNDGKRIAKSFSINTHDDAKQKAVEWRKAKEREFGYSQD